MRKIIAGLGMAALVLVAGASAQAATIGTVSGGSSAFAKTKFFVDWNVLNSNSAIIGNSVSAQGISGGNTLASSDDQNGTVVGTGNSESTVVVDNSANSNDVTVTAEVAGGASDAIGLADGGSNATAKFKSTDLFDAVSSNEILNENMLSSVSLAGGNNIISGGALNNTTLGTGGVNAQAGLTNAFNVNIKNVVRTVAMP